MADETVGQVADTSVTESSPAPVIGDTSAPAPVLEDTLNGEKIDVSKMTQEELKGYKRAQAHFTKFTQSYKTKEDELSGKLKSYDSLLGDELIRPLAHYRTYGRLPEGVDPTAFISGLQNALGVNAQQPAYQDPNVANVDDGTKAYINSMLQQALAPLQQKAVIAETFAKQEVAKKASSTIESFSKNLKDKDPKLGELFEKYVSNGQLTDALKKTPFSENFEERLRFAFNGLSTDEYLPLVQAKTRETLLKELQDKNSKDRPLSNGASGGVASTNKKDLRAILADEFDKIGG